MKPAPHLYICYFGLREPLVQTQVLPYLRQLRSEKLQVSLLTFEPRLNENVDAGRTRSATRGARGRRNLLALLEISQAAFVARDDLRHGGWARAG